MALTEGTRNELRVVGLGELIPRALPRFLGARVISVLVCEEVEVAYDNKGGAADIDHLALVYRRVDDFTSTREFGRSESLLGTLRLIGGPVAIASYSGRGQHCRLKQSDGLWVDISGKGPGDGIALACAYAKLVQNRLEMGCDSDELRAIRSIFGTIDGVTRSGSDGSPGRNGYSQWVSTPKGTFTFTHPIRATSEWVAHDFQSLL